MLIETWNNILKMSKSGKGILGSQKVFLSAIDTIIRKPDLVTKNAPHIREVTDLKRIMILVVFALIPCTLFGIWNVGRNSYASIGIYDASFYASFSEGFLHVFPLIIISYLAGGICEGAFAHSRGHEIAEGFLVTGLLYPLVCPPTIPWWMFILGIMFGVVVGKELFGGTGMNIVNPALLSRAFLFFAYPAAISGDEVWVKKPFYENSDGELHASSWTTIDVLKINHFIKSPHNDVVSGQTPLALATDLANSGNVLNVNEGINTTYSTMDMFLGRIPGSIGETSVLMCLLGASILILTRIGSWRTMLGVIIGALTITTMFMLMNHSSRSSLLSVSLQNHLLMGGFMFGTVFMATDPVSGPLHRKSQFIYGLGIGSLCILIRAINPAFPEGMMLSILFMNIFSPLIDHYITIFEINNRRSKRV